MNRNDYWVVYHTSTFRFFKFATEEEAILHRARQIDNHPRFAELLRIDNVQGITENQWLFWKQLQKA